MDPRMACLTVGDAGVALALEPTADPAVGLQDVELFTLGKYHDLCVARATTESHGGAIMYTEPVKSAVVTTRLAVQHCLEVLKRNDWAAESLRQLIMHQTSERTIDGAMQEINRTLGKEVVHRGNTVYNLAERGNCATNTHFLAVWENIQAGNIAAGRPRPVRRQRLGPERRLGPVHLRRPAAPPPPARRRATRPTATTHPETSQVIRLERPAADRRRRATSPAAADGAPRVRATSPCSPRRASSASSAGARSATRSNSCCTPASTTATSSASRPWRPSRRANSASTTTTRRTTRRAPCRTRRSRWTSCRAAPGR